jgi:hypothetical protein
MAQEGSLPLSEQPTTCPKSKPDQSSLRLQRIPLRAVCSENAAKAYVKFTARIRSKLV